MLYSLTLVVLQIVIESLPVSSSGNCALFTHLFELYTTIKTSTVPVAIDFLLHGPTIVVVGIYFFSTISWYLLHIRKSYQEVRLFIVSCMISGGITAIGYLLIRQLHLITIPLWLGLMITAGILFSLQWCTFIPTKKILSYKDACVLGMVQACALLPGISRFASTYVAARWIGFYPYHAFGYSFALELPLLGVAFLKGVYSVYSGDSDGDIFTLPLMGLVLLATVISYAVFVWVGRLVVENKIQNFGWYVLFTAVIAYMYGL